jgi:ArsR family transcriptional regulator
MKSASIKLAAAARPGRFSGPGKADTELSELCRALGHPIRVAIVRMLLERGGCICGDIVDRLPLAQATVSQHLKVLRETGWIEGDVDGPRICYGAHLKTLDRFRSLVQAFGAREASRRRTDGEGDE